MIKILNIYVDGACTGNPGEAAIGIIMYHNGEVVNEISKPIGEATNNIAEYSALVYALQEALMMKAENIQIHTDSELVFKQVAGRYKVKNTRLQFFLDQVRCLSRGFKTIDLKQIPREENKEADKLATQAIKKDKQIKMVASTVRIANGKVQS